MLIHKNVSLDEFIAHSTAAQSTDELIDIFLNFIAAFDIDCFAVGKLIKNSTAQQKEAVDIIVSHPQNWISNLLYAAYLANNLSDHEGDAYRIFCGVAAPQSENEKKSNSTLYRGITFLLHRPFGETIAASLFNSQKKIEHSKDVRGVLYAATNQFLVIHDKLIDESAVEGSTILTLREREVLIWLSRGKSKNDIAVILEISESAVKKYSENIFRKLDVDNLQLAIAKGLKLGLIGPY